MNFLGYGFVIGALLFFAKIHEGVEASSNGDEMGIYGTWVSSVKHTLLYGEFGNRKDGFEDFVKEHFGRLVVHINGSHIYFIFRPVESDSEAVSAAISGLEVQVEEGGGVVTEEIVNIRNSTPNEYVISTINAGVENRYRYVLSRDLGCIYRAPVVLEYLCKSAD